MDYFFFRWVGGVGLISGRGRSNGLQRLNRVDIFRDRVERLPFLAFSLCAKPIGCLSSCGGR